MGARGGGSVYAVARLFSFLSLLGVRVGGWTGVSVLRSFGFGFGWCFWLGFWRRLSVVVLVYTPTADSFSSLFWCLIFCCLA